jgi:hypothetical protein
MYCSRQWRRQICAKIRPNPTPSVICGSACVWSVESIKPECTAPATTDK